MVLPKSWSRRKMQYKFTDYIHIIWKTKHLVKEQTTLYSSNPKPGRNLPPFVVDIRGFFPGCTVAGA
jgi:hypothetical protein